MISPMIQPTTMPLDDAPMEEVPVRSLWAAAVGRVFKLVSRPYGIRQVTYTQVRAVKEEANPGEFSIEVLCVEIIARILDGKRTHSNICKEGVLHQAEDTELLPASFGEECPQAEFEKVTGAILAYTNTYLDWVMQDSPEEDTTIGVSVDLPCLELSAMEASLLRNSPFLVKDRYLLSPNSIRAANASIAEEMRRASRNMLLTDAVDPIYVAQKNEAAEGLRARLQQVQREVAAVRKEAGWAALELDSLTLALLGKPSATTICWVAANPSEEGMVARLGLACAPLEFVRWAHVSGRMVPEDTVIGREVRSYFGGWNQNYTGPDAEGIYPLLRPAKE